MNILVGIIILSLFLLIFNLANISNKKNIDVSEFMRRGSDDLWKTINIKKTIKRNKKGSPPPPPTKPKSDIDKLNDLLT